MKKMGRPTENPRIIRLHIRLSEKDNNLLEECTKITKSNKTDTIIQALELMKNEKKS